MASKAPPAHPGLSARRAQLAPQELSVHQARWDPSVLLAPPALRVRSVRQDQWDKPDLQARLGLKDRKALRDPKEKLVQSARRARKVPKVQKVRSEPSAA